MTETKHSFSKGLVRMGSMLLATCLMIVGVLIAFESQGSSRFFFGIMVVGIGVVLTSLIVDFLKGVK